MASTAIAFKETHNEISKGEGNVLLDDQHPAVTIVVP